MVLTRRGARMAEATSDTATSSRADDAQPLTAQLQWRPEETIQHIRANVIPAAAYERSNTKAFLLLAKSVTLCVLSFVCMLYAPWYAMPLAWILAGTSLCGLFVIGHDCAHNTSDHILVVGSGTSTLSEQMYADNYNDITNVDFSGKCIDAMSERCASSSGLIWLQMDVTTMDFPASIFDSVLDKGTFDSLLCGDEHTEEANDMLREVSKVLKPAGVFIIVTHGSEESRRNFLQREEYNWDVSCVSVPKPQLKKEAASGAAAGVHNVMIMKKRGGAAHGGK